MKIKTRNYTIPIVRGNLFDYVENYIKEGNNGFSVIVPHVCNNHNLFGAGFAAGVTKYYPIVKENYHLLGTKNVLGYTQFVTAKHNPIHKHKLIFANMIAQNGIISNQNKRPLNYYALGQCMDSVRKFIINNFDMNENKVQIHCPKFGCGLAGGNWNFIESLINDIWYEFQVFIYENKK